MTTPECIWNAKVEHGEGARYDPTTNSVWWVDILGQKILRKNLSSGEEKVWDTPEVVCCTYSTKDGATLALFRRSIVRLNEENGSFDTVIEFADEPENNRMNDGVVGPDGSIWAGSMDFDFQVATGALYRVDADKNVSKADSGYIVVNGPAFSPDGRILYVNETMKGEIYRFDVNPADQSLTGKSVFANFGEGEGLPDGICVDHEGGLWVAVATGGKVQRYLPDGNLDCEISVPCPTVTSVALGGRDGKTLFITTSRILMDDDTLAAHPLSGGLFAMEVNQRAVPSPKFGY